MKKSHIKLIEILLKMQIKTRQEVTNPNPADRDLDLLTIWEINNLSILILNVIEVH